MKKYKITAKYIRHLEIEIDAENYEEALRFAEDELITDEFDVVGTEFILGDVMEAKN